MTEGKNMDQHSSIEKERFFLESLARIRAITNNLSRMEEDCFNSSTILNGLRDVEFRFMKVLDAARKMRSDATWTQPLGFPPGSVFHVGQFVNHLHPDLEWTGSIVAEKNGRFLRHEDYRCYVRVQWHDGQSPDPEWIDVEAVRPADWEAIEERLQRTKES